MACIYFTASSLDGYIVDEADSLDWLTSRASDPSDFVCARWRKA